MTVDGLASRRQSCLGALDWLHFELTYCISFGETFMKARIATLTLALFAVVAVSALNAQDGKKQDTSSDAVEVKDKFVATCPVSGAAASEETFIEKDGKKTYFCCDNCAGAYKEDPSKYTAAANFQLLQTEQMVQVPALSPAVR